MPIFDLFTGQPGKTAAGQALNTFQGAQTQIGNLADATRRYNEDILRPGYANARADLSQGYDAATGAINTGATGALGYLDQGQTGALGRLDAAKSGITGAYRPLTDLASGYGDVTGLYRDALGVNGAAGNARAQGAFQAGPGYEFMVNQGLEAINRSRNARGQGSGGNIDRDAQLFGLGTANQEYGNWLNRLAPYEQLRLGATSGAAAGNAGAAGIDVTAANLLNQGGLQRAGISTGQGTTLADLANRYFGGQAGLDTGEAGALTNNMWQATAPQIQAQMAFAPGMAKTFQDSATAELQGQKNLWNLGMQAATAAAGGFGGMGGGATLADPTFGGFSRPGQNAAALRF